MTEIPHGGVVVVRPADGPVATGVRSAQTTDGARCVVVLLDGSDRVGDDDVLAVADASLPVVVGLVGDVEPVAAGLALAADLRVAAADARLRLDALVGGTSATLPHAVGDASARLLLLAPAALDAGACLDLGLVHEVHDDAVAGAVGLAALVADQPAGRGAAVRRALTRPDVALAIEDEARLRAVVARHDG